MSDADYLLIPDPHLKAEVAAVYDEAHAERFTDEVVRPAVAVSC